MSQMEDRYKAMGEYGNPIFQANFEYPKSDKYEYQVSLERLDLDEECRKDLSIGKGFLIKEPQDIKKVLKDIDGICSTRYGKTLQDPHAYEDRYSCKCGLTKGRNNRHLICPHCNTECIAVGDDFKIFGYIPLNENAIIHPNMYRTLAAYFGETTLDDMIEPKVEYNQDGIPISMYDKRLDKRKGKRGKNKRKVDMKYYGIGMIEFEKQFDEILEYFHNKIKKKEELYQSIVNNRNIIFTHHIPVFTTLLRPFEVEGKHLIFEETNSLLNMMAKIAGRLNDEKTYITNNAKYKASLLWDLQDRYNKLYKVIVQILSSKRGSIRMLIGGRCAFTSRLIISPEPLLHTDEVKLSYYALVELLQQTIINILAKTYNIPYAQAYQKWFHSQLVVDREVVMIIENLIEHGTKYGKGIPVLINRNPTISYGGVLCMRCIGINYSYTMSLPITILKILAADFDGDCLNILYITNEDFLDAAMEAICPRNCMIISPNDGRFDNNFSVFKDILININGLMYLSRDNYSEEQLNKIKALKAKYGK